MEVAFSVNALALYAKIATIQTNPPYELPLWEVVCRYSIPIMIPVYNSDDLFATIAVEIARYWRKDTYLGYIGHSANMIWVIAKDVGAIVLGNNGRWRIKKNRISALLNADEVKMSVEKLGYLNIENGWRPELNPETSRSQAREWLKWMQRRCLWGDRDTVMMGFRKEVGEPRHSPTRHSGFNVINLFRLIETAERVYIEKGELGKGELLSDGTVKPWTMDDFPHHKIAIVRDLYNYIFGHQMNAVETSGDEDVEEVKAGWRAYNRKPGTDSGHYPETDLDRRAYATWRDVFQRRVDAAINLFLATSKKIAPDIKWFDFEKAIAQSLYGA